MAATQTDKAKRFRALHEADEAFVIPNPWDTGSARLLAGLGYQALATTSSGFALTLGRADGDVGARKMIEHCRQLADASDLPVSADLENCYADAPDPAAQVLLEAARAGVVGASIEDYTGNPEAPLYDFELAVARVQAAVEAARTLDFPFTLTARAEGMLRGAGDLDDTIARLQAFEAVGADVLYAPGLDTLDQVRAVTSAVNAPVNVLMRSFGDASVGQLSDAGATRISTGGALALAARAALLRAGRQMQDDGGFGWISALAPGRDLDILKTP